ncbi:CoF synthetase [Nocardioides panzhihuensis]|uniref:Phenylacetate-CoA ligase n=1 Tax=Nocardioides panzhihuensis TaxID=860243 RepID=A0A7Z0DSQ9_9ACTN|nr:CoF synthetase [Nocardioides panzhihuensis]NYI80848.1 phenylacetate-CoA ligase [Nocardioides panzhihuensis]
MSETPDPLHLAEYTPMASAALTDAERWPGLSTAGAARLAAADGHPAAPVWRHRVGHRLTPAEQEAARAQLPLPGWLERHLAVARSLPAYRRHRGPLATLRDFPLITRQNLVDDIGGFVPLDADYGRMLHGTSSGSTGAALVMPDDPDELARGFHWLRDLVAGLTGDWAPDPARFAVVQVVWQRQAFTYVSVAPGFGESLVARVNLHPGEWAREDQRAFLRDADPQVVSGHPTSLEHLLDLREVVRPIAIVSSAMALSATLRADLTRTFECPVLDVYGLHETRPVAVSTDGGPFVVADRRVHVEVLGPDGIALPEGEIGEIAVTAGENAFLPLTRYRTGDTGRLVRVDGHLAIDALEGREATVFTSPTGALIPSVDLTQHLQDAGARGWSVEQAADGAVVATIAGGDAGTVAARLGALLSRDVTVRRVETLADLGEGKPRRYRSAVPRGGITPPG